MVVPKNRKRKSKITFTKGFFFLTKGDDEIWVIFSNNLHRHIDFVRRRLTLHYAVMARYFSVFVGRVLDPNWICL